MLSERLKEVMWLYLTDQIVNSGEIRWADSKVAG